MEETNCTRRDHWEIAGTEEGVGAAEGTGKGLGKEEL